jgi:spore germination protein GerM
MKKLLAFVTLALAGGALAVALTACGSEQAVSLGKPSQGTTTATTGEQTGSVPTKLSLQVWFTRDDGLVSVERTHDPTPLVATTAIDSLLDGPTASERVMGFASAVPTGTKLLGIAIHNGVATVDLTSEFQDGAGSRSMQMRLGQVVYTLTQFPTGAEGALPPRRHPVNVFSSEGIVLDHPVGRPDYSDLLPAITVAKPASDSSVTSPVTVAGTANVFEANVSIEVLNANGDVVGKTFTTASCGTGCRGTYSVPVSFKVAKAQSGTIVVHDDDAAGTGRPPHEVRVPVTLAP